MSRSCSLVFADYLPWTGLAGSTGVSTLTRQKLTSIAVARFDSPLHDAAERFDSALHHAAGSQTSIQITAWIWTKFEKKLGHKLGSKGGYFWWEKNEGPKSRATVPWYEEKAPTSRYAIWKWKHILSLGTYGKIGNNSAMCHKSRDAAPLILSSLCIVWIMHSSYKTVEW